jgi:serralysin
MDQSPAIKLESSPPAVERSIPTAPPCVAGLVAPQAGVMTVRCEEGRSERCLSLSFDEDFDRLDLWDPVKRQGRWKTNFAHGPQSGPMAWDSRTLKGNHERQIYVDERFPGTGRMTLGVNPFEIRDGVLSIVADRTPTGAKGYLWGFDFTSGLLTTQRSFAQLYGYFEIRAQLPQGKGLWPAFWLLPASAAWPPEIDVFEQTGGERILQTVHMLRGAAPAETGFSTQVEGATRDFHAYGVLWTPSQITWFVDGRATASTSTPAGLDKPMYMLLNLAVGGALPGDPDASTAWPARLKVDYVRAYRLSEAEGACGQTPGH